MEKEMAYSDDWQVGEISQLLVGTPIKIAHAESAKVLNTPSMICGRSPSRISD